jgi:hypothetical protein
MLMSAKKGGGMKQALRKREVVGRSRGFGLSLLWRKMRLFEFVFSKY